MRRMFTNEMCKDMRTVIKVVARLLVFILLILPMGALSETVSQINVALEGGYLKVTFEQEELTNIEAMVLSDIFFLIDGDKTYVMMLAPDGSLVVKTLEIGSDFGDMSFVVTGEFNNVFFIDIYGMKWKDISGSGSTSQNASEQQIARNYFEQVIAQIQDGNPNEIASKLKIYVDFNGTAQRVAGILNGQLYTHEKEEASSGLVFGGEDKQPESTNTLDIIEQILPKMQENVPWSDEAQPTPTAVPTPKPTPTLEPTTEPTATASPTPEPTPKRQAAPCGIANHWIDDGLNHEAAACAISNHFNCVGNHEIIGICEICSNEIYACTPETHAFQRDCLGCGEELYACSDIKAHEFVELCPGCGEKLYACSDLEPHEFAELCPGCGERLYACSDPEEHELHGPCLGCGEELYACSDFEPHDYIGICPECDEELYDCSDFSLHDYINDCSVCDWEVYVCTEQYHQVTVCGGCGTAIFACDSNHSIRHCAACGEDYYKCMNTSTSCGGDNPHTASCFTGDTRIETINGAKPICDLKVGDFVLSRDPQTQSMAYMPITAVHTHDGVNALYYIESAEGILKTTREHPIYVVEKNDFVQAETIKAGDTLLDAKNRKVKVVAAYKVVLPEPITVYNLTVDGYNTYFADVIFVHNKACFTGNTLIKTALGDRPLNQISVGDLVYGRNAQTGKVGYFPVLEVQVHEKVDLLRCIETSNGLLKATMGHPVYVAERAGFVRADAVKAGDTLINAQGEALKVYAAYQQALKVPVTTYNLIVSECMSYFAENILVSSAE